jgi:acetolactate synthase-1/2/3 large subunit
VNGAEYLVRALSAEGVDHLFMVPGGMNDPFMAPMTETPGVRTIVAAFEGGAAFMADGWSRATGRVGAAFGIGGPGILNMATALASARSDRSTVLAVSGEVPVSWEGRGGFQDATGPNLDDTVVLRGICDLSTRVESASMLDHQLRTLLLHALARKAPVHLSIPKDLQTAEQHGVWTPLPESAYVTPVVDGDALDRLLGLFTGGDVPANVVALAGPGVRWSGVSDCLVELAERWDVPVATTLGAKGVMPEDHPLALGVFGYGGSRWATEAVLDPAVEVLIVLGSGLSQRDTLQWDPAMLPSRALVHVDADPTLIGRLWPSEIPVVGDCGAVLRALAGVEGDAARGLEAGRDARRRFLDGIKAHGPMFYDVDTRHSDAVPMHPARVVHTAREVFPRDTVAVIDSGAHRAFAAQHWPAYGPRDYLSTTNMGPMGAAVPLGIGSALARPGQPHVVVTSDGCMLMHGMELHTAVRERVPLTLLVLDNHSYGNIWYRAHQMGDGPSHLTDIPNADWLAFGRAMGADGERVEQPGDLSGAFERAAASTVPYVVDARTDKTADKPTAPWAEAVKEWEDTQ